MNNFKDFGIKPKLNTFLGDKIKIDRVLNTPITVHRFKIEDSKRKPGTKFLTLQIEKDGNKHIIFSGSTILIDMIQQVPTNKFPFSTTIIKEAEHLEFT